MENTHYPIFRHIIWLHERRQHVISESIDEAWEGGYVYPWNILKSSEIDPHKYSQMIIKEK